MQSACTYNNGVALQKDANFSTNFIADYLVNPNNLLTHTFAPGITAIRYFIVRARVRQRVFPISKGLS